MPVEFHGSSVWHGSEPVHLEKFWKSKGELRLISKTQSGGEIHKTAFTGELSVMPEKMPIETQVKMQGFNPLPRLAFHRCLPGQHRKKADVASDV
ncbi:hypothetical protein HAX54_046516 [Datura stramonium]|uniref:Uncharacterized protein n=1 Tax=Datura stramonium TaxID=4076 RepID=A0ABS8SRE5_DATST|nr:hypothetical protein [Datura stramonium]